jgi:Transposase DDE domain
MPSALDWLATAQECCSDAYGALRQGLLTSIFSLVIGLERVFHLQQMEDPGFALLSGGRCCPSRHLIGGWRRHLSWYEVDAFCRRTCPWHLLHREDALVSFDEHTIPRWTRKFSIGKGYVTTRNKYMRCEKLFTGYDLTSGRFLCVRGTPGNCHLQELAVPLLQQVLRQGRPHSLHALFDAGAGKSDAGVRALWDLVEQHPNLDVTLRACRYPHRLRAWKQLPSDWFVSLHEPGVCLSAAPKEVRLAETRTVLKDEQAEQAIRTIICREVRPGPKKDRWHPLYTTSTLEPQDLLPLYRARQQHEQGHRVEVHDLLVNAVPCGYDKDSPDRKRPRFHRGPLQMIGWLVALVYNAVADLAEKLEPDHRGAHVRTLRRKFFNRPGQLYETPEALIVYLDPFQGQDDLLPLIDKLNAGNHRLPWLDNRRLLMSLMPHGRVRPGP